MKIKLIFLLFFISFFAKAQDEGHRQLVGNERLAATMHLGALGDSEARGYDVIHQELNVSVDPAVNAIEGFVVTSFKVTVGGLTSLLIDLRDGMSADSVKYQGSAVSFTHSNDLITIPFSSPLSVGVMGDLTIYYHGSPTATGWGAFVQSEHDGAPIIWTLSQPYGAYEWWPCKQDLNDKIDSLDVIVKVPSGNKVGSNGLLISEVEDNGFVTFHWKHQYPIPTYLVAFATTNYVEYTDIVPTDEGDITMLNYVYPENLDNAQAGTASLIPVMQLYNDLFGMYPYKDEKYGHAQFGWTGGMEHTTMTFIGPFNQWLLSHELAHQWFGDDVTCGSWEDIWLNEGFATYLEGMIYEHNLNPYPFKSWLQDRIDVIISEPGGSVLVDDTTSVDAIFDYRLTYSKGAMVLHMLRWTIGDDDFFQGVRNYLQDPALHFGFSKTDQLKAHLEATSGQDLTEFFDSWYSGEGYPIYDISWEQGSDNLLHIHVNQTQSVNTGYFKMPLEFLAVGDSGSSDFVVQNNSDGQDYSIQLDFQISGLIFDPNRWIVSESRVVGGAAFVTTWKTDNPGVSNSTSITIPTDGAGYNYDVDWDDDGVFDEFGITGSVTHDFGVAGTYRVSIRGAFPRILFNFEGDRHKIMTIEQWGDIAWTSMDAAFAGADNLTSNASDSPLLVNVSNTALMFAGAWMFNGDVSNWDVSHVTNMWSMFDDAKLFNGDVSSWDVSSVTDMGYMFKNATSFTGDVSNWNMSNVEYTYAMFEGSPFNGDISSWDVGNVVSMSWMFKNATSFNADLNSWDVSKVTSMWEMFNGATSFNGDVSSWDVGNVTSMWVMFANAHSFNGDVSSWDVGKVTDMAYMFANAHSFNGDLNNWDVSHVTNMWGMFDGADSFNGDVSSWDVGSVEQMGLMFRNATSFTGDVSNWDVSHVVNMVAMFEGTPFNGNVSSWDVGSVTDMAYMFKNATSFNGDLNSWDVSKVTSMYAMFDGADSFNGDVSSWDVGSVEQMGLMFRNATSFTGDVSNWAVSHVVNMVAMFEGAPFNGNVSSWDVGSVTDMGYMFKNATSFNGDLNSWDVSKVTSMWEMFDGATSFNQNLGGWDIGSVQWMNGLLSDAGLSVSNYDSTLIGWKNQGVGGLTLDADGLRYCNSETERAFLINSLGWTINGDSLDCSILPVELVDFDVRLMNGDDVLLTWKTDAEMNNSGYEIQKSYDATDWEAIGFVKGKGSTSEIIHYQHIDKNPYIGVNYYRLKQIDFDGDFEYSRVLSANVIKQNEIEIYPNPTKGKLEIRGVDEGEMKIVNSQGNVVRRLLITSQYVDISELSKGVYFVFVKTDKGVVIERIIKE